MSLCKKILLIIAILVGATILFFFNPEKAIWLPKCPIYLLTGYQCPACGTQRALYHLLHFNFSKAFHFNPFLLISMPYVVSLMTVTWFDKKNRFVKLRNFCFHHITIDVYLVLIILWWILRNII